MKSRALTATGLRALLTGSLFATLFIAAAGFLFANSQLDNFAVKVSHANADAAASQGTVQNLQAIEKKLEANQATVEKASSVVAESQSYQYQNQIITDLNGYASEAGLAITNIAFTTGATDPSASQTPPTPTSPIPAGVKSTSASITLATPVDYMNLLRFMKSIEQNLTKMQISRVNISKAAEGGVTTDALTIQVYIR